MFTSFPHLLLTQVCFESGQNCHFWHLSISWQKSWWKYCRTIFFSNNEFWKCLFVQEMKEHTWEKINWLWNWKKTLVCSEYIRSNKSCKRYIVTKYYKCLWKRKTVEIVEIHEKNREIKLQQFPSKKVNFTENCKKHDQIFFANYTILWKKVKFSLTKSYSVKSTLF